MPVTHFRRSLVTALFLLASAGACASSGASAAGTSTSGSRYVITESELPTSGTESAYDAVQRLRPEFLRARPAQSYNLQSDSDIAPKAPAPVLMLNGQHIGEIADLRQIAATSLKTVRYYNIEQAKRKFGMQYQGGAIEIEYK